MNNPDSRLPDPNETTSWIVALKSGQAEAAQKLWEEYFSQLVAVARRRLGDFPRRTFDEEDIALSAFGSFCRRAAADTFPQLNDRKDLWALLVTITARKVLQRKRFLTRQRRGGGTLVGESAFGAGDEDNELAGMAQVIGTEPAPDFAALVAEELDQLLDRLGNESLRQIAVAKLEGYSNQEIADQLGMTDRTVRRKLHVIGTLLESSM